MFFLVKVLFSAMITIILIKVPVVIDIQFYLKFFRFMREIIDPNIYLWILVKIYLIMYNVFFVSLVAESHVQEWSVQTKGPFTRNLRMQ